MDGMTFLPLAAISTGFLTDIAYARWLLHAAARERLIAANWSVATYLCGVFSAFLVVERNWLAVVAYGVGCWLGTMYGLKGRKLGTSDRL